MKKTKVRYRYNYEEDYKYKKSFTVFLQSTQKKLIRRITPELPLAHVKKLPSQFVQQIGYSSERSWMVKNIPSSNKQKDYNLEIAVEDDSDVDC